MAGLPLISFPKVLGIPCGPITIVAGVAVSPPPPSPVACITVGNLALGNLAIFGNTSTNASSYAWEISFATPAGFPGGDNGFNMGAGIAGNWTGDNPGTANVVNPAPGTTFRLAAQQTVPLGGYTLTLTATGTGSDTDTLYLLHSGVSGVSNTLTSSTTQAGAISDLPTGNATGGSGQIAIDDLTLPANATLNAVYVTDDSENWVQSKTTASASASFSGLNAGDYNVYVYGGAMGRVGPAAFFGTVVVS